MVTQGELPHEKVGYVHRKFELSCKRYHVKRFQTAVQERTEPAHLNLSWTRETLETRA